MSKPSTCHRCSASVIWVRLVSGKFMACEPLPDILGNIAARKISVHGYTGWGAGFQLSKHNPKPVGYEVFRPHVAGCRPAKATPMPDDVRERINKALEDGRKKFERR